MYTGSIKPVSTDHGHNRPTVLKDHLDTTKYLIFQCNWTCDQRPCVSMVDYILTANRVVFQDRFCCVYTPAALLVPLLAFQPILMSEWFAWGRTSATPGFVQDQAEGYRNTETTYFLAVCPNCVSSVTVTQPRPPISTGAGHALTTSAMSQNRHWLP